MNAPPLAPSGVVSRSQFAGPLRRRTGQRPHFDWVVVGAGLSGATMAERIASQLSQRVLVIERRDHIGGNAHDAVNDVGIRVHRYGAHIFHTRSRKVWTYLSRFTTWLPYVHRVRARLGNELVPLPVNLDTVKALYPRHDAILVQRRLISLIGMDARVPVLRLIDHPDALLREFGQRAYDSIFLKYTVKQWGMLPEQIDRAVTGRVPIVVSREDRYFPDTYQGIPADGYTAMVERMLDHPNITVALDTEHSELEKLATFDRMIYTGPIDEFFHHEHGPLPYRSLRFEHRNISVDRVQPVAVVNHPDDAPYTRIIEHAHFGNQHLGVSTITFEYPEQYDAGSNEPFYPLPHSDSHSLYSIYGYAADRLAGRVLFVGRLAEYKYYDMDQAVAHALVMFRRVASRHARRLSTVSATERGAL